MLMSIKTRFGEKSHKTLAYLCRMVQLLGKLSQQRDEAIGVVAAAVYQRQVVEVAEIAAGIVIAEAGVGGGHFGGEKGVAELTQGHEEVLVSSGERGEAEGEGGTDALAFVSERVQGVLLKLMEPISGGLGGVGCQTPADDGEGEGEVVEDVGNGR